MPGGQVRAVRRIPGGGPPVLPELWCAGGGVPVVWGAGYCRQPVLPCVRAPAGWGRARLTGDDGAAARLCRSCGPGGGAAGLLGAVCDLVGFTPLSEARDPEVVRELLSQYFERARTVIGRYGGTVEKFIGDAVMAVWGTPVAAEGDAERRCAQRWAWWRRLRTWARRRARLAWRRGRGL